eukprot:COSAG02_NODE_36509_length_453_cov_1.573446_1_plen_118_part_10
MDDSSTCSPAAGLETRLGCEPAGGAAGYYIDADGRATRCADGTTSAVGEVSTAGCSDACTIQAGCATSSTATCSVDQPSKLACTSTAPDYYLHGTNFEIAAACPTQMVHAPSSYPSDA